MLSEMDSVTAHHLSKYVICYTWIIIIMHDQMETVFYINNMTDNTVRLMI